jgi:hypothetical protein
MSAERLLTTIADAGLSIRIDGENLKISGDLARLSDTLKEQISEHKPDLLELLAANDFAVQYHGFTLADLQAEAHPDEWPDIRDNPKALSAFALALVEDRQIQAGIRPQRFTALMYCSGCGVVPMPPTWPTIGDYEALDIPQVNGCRWCGNRLEGRHYPKAYPLPPDGFDQREEGRWPYSPDCRPLVWQGSAERKGADNA